MVDRQVVTDLQTVIVDIEDKLKLAGLKCSEFDMRSTDVAPWLVALRFVAEGLEVEPSAEPARPECRTCGRPMQFDPLVQMWACP